MACEVITKNDQGGLAWVLDEVDARLSSRPQDARRWAFVEVKSSNKEHVHLYLPALSRVLREACASAKVFWVECAPKSAPSVVLKLLESSLCSGVLLRGLEQFEKSQPASLWGRRWQLASQRSATELFWVHEKMQPMIGFNQRLSWLSGECEWIRGRKDVFKNYQPAA